MRNVLAVIGLQVLALVGLQVAAMPAAMPAPRAAGSDSTLDRTLRDSRVMESSGLAPSRRAPGVVWTHNDSGNSPTLYAIGSNGATVGTARVSGVGAVDWEALAPVTGPDGDRLLAIGDIGDNPATRSRIEIDLVPEPAVKGTSRISPVRVLRLRYPDGPADAEALLADPRNGRLYVVTKGFLSSTIYAVPSAAWPGDPRTGRTVTATLQPVARVSLSLVTDGAMLMDGRVVLRTYSSLALLPPLSLVSESGSDRATGVTSVPTLNRLALISLPAQPQGEGLAVVDDAAGVLLLSTEGAGSAILRLSVPPDVWNRGTPVASSAPDDPTRPAAPENTASGARAKAGALLDGSPFEGASRGGAGGWLVTLAGAAAFAVLLMMAWVFARRHRS